MKSSSRQDLFQFLKTAMRFAVMYPWNVEKHCSETLKPIVKRFEFMIEIFLYFVVIQFPILYACTIFKYYHTGSLEYLVDCLMQIIIYLWTLSMKLYFRRVNPQQLEEIMQLFNSNYQYESVSGFTYVTMKNGIKLSEKLTKTFVYCCVFGTLLYLTLPIIYGDRSLPLACWYPFDYKQPIVYETMYFLQSIGQLQVSTSFSTSAGMFLKLTILCCSQFDVLFCNLKNLLATAYIQSKVGHHELNELSKLYEIDNSMQLDEYYTAKECRLSIQQLIAHRAKLPTQSKDFLESRRSNFRKCVDLHRFLFDVLQRTERFFTFVLLIKSGEIISLLCLVAFVSVKSSGASVMKFIVLAQYLVLILWDLTILCYFGEMVNVYSQRCGEAILRSPWYLYMKDMKQDLLFFITTTQKPFRLTAGKIYQLNLNTFRAVLTTAFSFLTLLQRIDEQKA